MFFRIHGKAYFILLETCFTSDILSTSQIPNAGGVVFVCMYIGDRVSARPQSEDFWGLWNSGFPEVADGSDAVLLWSLVCPLGICTFSALHCLTDTKPLAERKLNSEWLGVTYKVSFCSGDINQLIDQQSSHPVNQSTNRFKRQVYNLYQV